MSGWRDAVKNKAQHADHRCAVDTGVAVAELLLDGDVEAGHYRPDDFLHISRPDFVLCDTLFDKPCQSIQHPVVILLQIEGWRPLWSAVVDRVA